MNIKHLSRDGQTVIELAVFGSILIFVISLIVRQQINYSMVQNNQLRAMRWALAMSHQYSEDIIDQGEGEDGDMSRNVASVVVVEDRLTADYGKYGAIDRIPLMSIGEGTHSRNLNMPFEYGEHYNIPVTDMIINNQHFVFTTGDFRRVPIEGVDACPVFWVKRYNYPFSEFQSKWCDRNLCPGAGGVWNTVEWRFDLDHSGCAEGGCDLMPITAIADPDVPASPASLRDNFTWQWAPVFAGEIDPENQQNVMVDVDWCCAYDPWAGKDWCAKGGDPETEYVMKKEDGFAYVFDSQLGDIDFTQETNPPVGLQRDMDIETYLQKGAGGTSLHIEEAKHDPCGTGKNSLFIRTTQKKHSVDMVQRVIQLSNDTNRFCDRDGHVTCSHGSNEDDCDKALWEKTGISNPVKACNDCWSGTHRQVTCMDEGDPNDDPPRRPVIFVRSKVVDNHGRRWVTNIDDDPYVNMGR